MPDGKSGEQISFGLRWTITREGDRINRSSQKGIPLDARIYKLFSYATTFILEDPPENDSVPAPRILQGKYEKDQIKPEYREWLKRFLEIETENPSSTQERRRQRWEQLNLLQVCFKREGVYFEEDLPIAQLNFQEHNLD